MWLRSDVEACREGRPLRRSATESVPRWAALATLRHTSRDSVTEGPSPSLERTCRSQTLNPEGGYPPLVLAAAGTRVPRRCSMSFTDDLLLLTTGFSPPDSLCWPLLKPTPAGRREYLRSSGKSQRVAGDGRKKKGVHGVNGSDTRLVLIACHRASSGFSWPTKLIYWKPTYNLLAQLQAQFIEAQVHLSLAHSTPKASWFPMHVSLWGSSFFKAEVWSDKIY